MEMLPILLIMFGVIFIASALLVIPRIAGIPKKHLPVILAGEVVVGLILIAVAIFLHFSPGA
ncbi:hypothetical protein [Sphingomicrobium sediminis]|uniref:Uncharacterized protein n=1 Tax=Sphingomicrobium sediminis TaxID=2950949 RepID=A0A9X2J1Z8_9SPHN|nr:hypothetical protein [Sphingomicrobium sediminis]MCM8557768.1 hypothetical protein [Sphingomicrobium sediminis]